MRPVNCDFFPERCCNRISISHEIPYNTIAVPGPCRKCRRRAYHLECDDCCLWQQGLKPNVRCLMLNDKPVTSLKDAIDSARRHEDTGLAGGHISTLYQQVPHRALGRFASHPSPQSRAGRGRADLFQGKVALLATVWEPSPSSMYSPDFVQEQPHDRAVLHPPSGST